MPTQPLDIYDPHSVRSYLTEIQQRAEELLRRDRALNKPLFDPHGILIVREILRLATWKEPQR